MANASDGWAEATIEVDMDMGPYLGKKWREKTMKIPKKRKNFLFWKVGLLENQIKIFKAVDQ